MWIFDWNFPDFDEAPSQQVNLLSYHININILYRLNKDSFDIANRTSKYIMVHDISLLDTAILKSSSKVAPTSIHCFEKGSNSYF